MSQAQALWGNGRDLEWGDCTGGRDSMLEGLWTGGGGAEAWSLPWGDRGILSIPGVIRLGSSCAREGTQEGQGGMG